MLCRDLLNMKEIKDNLKLVAGEKGLMRTIRWIYFADCLECLEENENLLEWIHGGELIIFTTKFFLGNANKLEEIMRLFNKKNIAGFAINDNQTPESVKRCADEMGIPIFEIKFKLKMIDLSQILCCALAEEIRDENTISQLFASILYSDDLSELDIAHRAEHYGINLNQPHFVVAFDIDHFTKEVLNQNMSEEKINTYKESLLSYIKSECYAVGLTRVITMMQGDAVLVLLPSKIFSEKHLSESVVRIQKRFLTENNMTVSVGVGEIYYHIDEFAKSAEEAKEAVKAIHIEERENKVVYYRDIGIYFLISQIKERRYMESYVEKLLGPLIEADKFSDSNLCETLKCYFAHGCNSNETAQTLFLHRNTMRYRLEKISNLLHRDLNNVDDCMELNIAFYIKKYLENTEH